MYDPTTFVFRIVVLLIAIVKCEGRVGGFVYFSCMDIYHEPPIS